MVISLLSPMHMQQSYMEHSRLDPKCICGGTRLDFASIDVSPPINRQVAFLQAPANALVENLATGNETSATPAFPSLPAPPLLPMGCSPPRYTWTRNQTIASSSRIPGNSTQHRTSIANPPSVPRIPGTDLLNSPQAPVDPRNVVDMKHSAITQLKQTRTWLKCILECP